MRTLVGSYKKYFKARGEVYKAKLDFEELIEGNVKVVKLLSTRLT
jgi:hypothetical protein